MSVLSLISWQLTLWICSISLVLLGVWTKLCQDRFKRWASRPLTDPRDTPPNWQPTAHRLADAIQDSRQAERSYLDALRDIRSTANKLPDACVIITQEGRIGEMNSAAEEHLGLTRNDTGEFFAALIRDHAVNQALALGQYDQAIELPSPTNEFKQLEVRLIPLDETRLLLVARDVTQLNKLLSMRQDFIANVSHELRSPLTTLLGYTELLLDDEQDSKTMQEHAQRLQAPAFRMKSLVEDLLTLTQLESSPHIDSARTTTIDGKQLIENVVEEAKLLSMGKHNFILNVDPQIQLECVETEIHSATLNLISNAIRYSPNGGDIHIGWYSPLQGIARFAVRDQGIGIPAEHLNRITERFYRVPSQPQQIPRGTGLGLAIVKHILLRHHSKLDIESEFGTGSEFRFDIPQQVNVA